MIYYSPFSIKHSLSYSKGLKALVALYLEAYKIQIGLLINFGAARLEFKRVHIDKPIPRNRVNPIIGVIGVQTISKFRGVFDIAKISNFNERELREYEADMKYLDDYNAAIAYAEREAFGKGDKSGFGRGVTQERKNFLKLIDQGYSLAQIKRMLSKKAAVHV